MRRRHFLACASASAFTGCGIDWRQGVLNSCAHPMDTPAEPHLATLIAASWDGIDATDVWDVHAHLIGNGDSGGGAWVNPKMTSGLHPILRTQYQFYLDAACIERPEHLDEQYLQRLMLCQSALAPGNRLMLLAFDMNYSVDGVAQQSESAIYVPNSYARAISARFPHRVEWIASIHPYREDALDVLAQAVNDGARAIKWLPPTMNIDPSSEQCDAFYDALARYDLPLLTHGGHERAVHGANVQDYGNPLKLRRALDRGVRVIVAHCASLGSGRDLDKGAKAADVDNFSLFARLMDDKHYEGLVYGDISAMTQRNRAGKPLEVIINRDDWHANLLNGSDYPLPGIVPLISLSQLVDRELLTEKDATSIGKLRAHNPLLFDFVLKRSLRYQGRRLGNAVFETRRAFETRASTLAKNAIEGSPIVKHTQYEYAS